MRGLLDRLAADKERVDITVELLWDVKDSLFATIRFTLWEVRQVFFTRERSGADSVVVPLSAQQAEAMLSEHHFEPGWWLSYSFRGEELNMRRPEHRVIEPGKAKWWQSHVRGYSTETDGGEAIELTWHVEPEPKEHPTEHLIGPADYEEGAALLKSLLDDHGIEYELAVVE
ncbi:hypothetical protein CV102_17910 [Natronococcus pandeyae]|uniref:Uncharacterized protein n=1 Tax=Natronococcus pandeyae TaxID=2055836 RepID=A0A8J8PYH9_9EURY|nr:hypothetical protein CV102_17910 [Natronococcus pandeyae]